MVLAAGADIMDNHGFWRDPILSTTVIEGRELIDLKLIFKNSAIKDVGITKKLMVAVDNVRNPLANKGGVALEGKNARIIKGFSFKDDIVFFGVLDRAVNFFNNGNSIFMAASID